MEYVVKIIAEFWQRSTRQREHPFCWRHLSCASICLAGNREPVQWFRGMDPSVPHKRLVQETFFPGILCKYDAVSDTFVPDNLGKSSGSCARHLEFT